MKTNLLLTIAICGMISCKTQTPATTNKQAVETETKLPVADNSRNSVDWPGTYTGNLPCADCQGIQTTLALRKDQTYTLQTKYTGKSEKVTSIEGTFSWNSQGSIITLKPSSGNSAEMYQVGENVLFKLDQQGNRITGVLADRYKLVKSADGLTEKYWKLTELYGKKIEVKSTHNNEPHMILKTQESRVQGNGGCNSFFGSYKLEPGNRITFSGIGNTMMACPEMETESQFLKAIQAADSYILKGDTLILHKARMAPLARFEAVYLR